MSFEFIETTASLPAGPSANFLAENLSGMEALATFRPTVAGVGNLPTDVDTLLQDILDVDLTIALSKQVIDNLIPTETLGEGSDLPPGYTPYGDGGYYMIDTSGNISLTPDWQHRVDTGTIDWAGVLSDLAIIFGSGVSILGGLGGVSRDGFGGRSRSN